MKLSTLHLLRLVALNSFPLPKDPMVFVGLRGMLPKDPNNQALSDSHEVELAEVTYQTPRCTLLQWLPLEGKFATYPGSTVPNIRAIRGAVPKNGVGTNQLMTGFYVDYRKGTHKAGTPNAHQAFRQSAARPIQRTADDLDYQSDDRIEWVNPGDNIHAGWCGLDTMHASAGCQVLVGYPKCEKRGNAPASGPWAVFQERAYALSQDRFPYILLDGGYVARLVEKGSQGLVRLRYGSLGTLVKELQVALKARGFYEGALDGLLQARTHRAVIEFQRATFGESGVDGVVGPNTAKALGLNWPNDA